MRKLLLAVALAFVPFGVFADDFDELAQTMIESRGANRTVRIDRFHRIVFVDIRLSGRITALPEEQLAEIRSEMTRELRRELGGVIRSTGARIIINYLTGGGRIYSVVVGPEDV